MRKPETDRELVNRFTQSRAECVLVATSIRPAGELKTTLSVVDATSVKRTSGIWRISNPSTSSSEIANPKDWRRGFQILNFLTIGSNSRKMKFHFYPGWNLRLATRRKKWKEKKTQITRLFLVCLCDFCHFFFFFHPSLKNGQPKNLYKIH